MKDNLGVAYVLVLIPLGIAVYCLFGSRLLPAGYELAIDGFVISRTLMIIFVLHLVSKIGFTMIDKSKEE